MKTAIFTTILISSMTIFSGCTNSQPDVNEKIKKEAKAIEVEKLIGINKGGEDNLFIVQKEETPKYHFIMRQAPVERVSIEDLPDATTIPINPPKPVISEYNNNYSSYEYDRYASNYTPDISGDIEIVSYGNPTISVSDHNKIYNSSKNKLQKLESSAKSFLGTKYVWGATGPNKFDCSGFTQWVFRDVGIEIPRVSRNQAKVGEYVSFENLKKGDMVFFDTRKKKRGVVTHVGIYLGNGNFIHASSKAKKVVIYNFNDKPYYKKRFLWGRRLINTTNQHYASNY